jgi:hypothetical protein
MREAELPDWQAFAQTWSVVSDGPQNLENALEDSTNQPVAATLKRGMP